MIMDAGSDSASSATRVVRLLDRGKVSEAAYVGRTATVRTHSIVSKIFWVGCSCWWGASVGIFGESSA